MKPDQQQKKQGGVPVQDRDNDDDCPGNKQDDNVVDKTQKNQEKNKVNKATKANNNNNKDKNGDNQTKDDLSHVHEGTHGQIKNNNNKEARMVNDNKDKNTDKSKTNHGKGKVEKVEKEEKIDDSNVHAGCAGREDNAEKNRQNKRKTTNVQDGSTTLVPITSNTPNQNKKKSKTVMRKIALKAIGAMVKEMDKQVKKYTKKQLEKRKKRVGRTDTKTAGAPANKKSRFES